MTPESFLRHRRRVTMKNPKEAARRKGMARLARTSGAKMVFIGRKHVGWKLPGGSIVCVKERFCDEQRAQAAMDRIRDRQPFGDRVPIRAYQCSECLGWHLTSEEKK